MSKTWRLAKSLEILRAEVDAAYPNRPDGADGTIGDEAHASRKSDHNPNPPHAGVVTAWDITTASFTDALAEQLRRRGKAGDRRVKYVIYKGRVASSRDAWAWRTYTGPSGHFDHIHLSVSDDPAHYDSTAPWNLTKARRRPIPRRRKNYPTLHQGSTGQAVLRLQRLLKIVADGDFGPDTEAAVRAFQRRKRLRVDGIAGPKTLRKLGF